MPLKPWQIAAQLAGILSDDDESKSILREAANYEREAQRILPDIKPKRIQMTAGAKVASQKLAAQKNKGDGGSRASWTNSNWFNAILSALRKSSSPPRPPATNPASQPQIHTGGLLPSSWSPNWPTPPGRGRSSSNNSGTGGRGSSGGGSGNNRFPSGAGGGGNGYHFLPATTVNHLKTGGTYLPGNNQQWGWLGVHGHPSMRLEQMQHGGAKTILERHSVYADFVQNADLTKLRQVMNRVKGFAKSLSLGRYSTKQLARMGHPYSTRNRKVTVRQKKPRGIANLSVTNIQSGRFYVSWHYRVKKTKRGVELDLFNDTEYAWYLAAGTRKMKAHGPFTAAMVKYMPQINLAWMGAAANAKRMYLQQATNDAAKSTFTR